MNPFVERVRDAADIQTLGQELTPLTPKGNQMTGVCPFHTESDASFFVYTEDPHWYCYGCGRGGSVFDLVMVAQQMSFWESVLHLAERYNIPRPELTEEEKLEIILTQQIEEFLGEYITASVRRMEKHPEVLEYLHGRGITDESIAEYRIGVSARPNKDADKAMVQASGLYDSRLTGRLVFPILRHGRVAQVSARSMDGKEPKYLSLSRPLFPWNAHKLRSARCILVEGVMDALTLTQAGFTTCATIHAGMKQEWVTLVGPKTEIVCCYDADENGAGQAANEKVGGMLFDGGRRVYVAELPKPHDPASYILEAGAGGMQEVLDRAKPYVDYQISKLQVGDSYAMQTEIDRVFTSINRAVPVALHDKYTAQIAKQLHLPKQGIRNGLKAFIRENKARNNGRIADVDDEFAILRREVNPIHFNPAQDVIDDILYYTIYMQTLNKEFHPFVITSNKECFRLTTELLLERDFIKEPGCEPFDQNRWSIGSNDPYNVYDYLDGKTHIDPRALFVNIKWYFTRFLLLPDPAYYDFLTLWCMATYHFRLFDSFGYLFLNAIKGSGKTQALTIMSWLAFNANQADSITEASLKRMVNSNSSTLLNDEAEKLCKKMEDDQSTIFEVWNGGYKKSGKAFLVNKDTMKPEPFCTYSPKALANTRGLDNILEDRCITLYFRKDIGKIPQLVAGEQAQRVANLRNTLYCFSLEYIEEIAESAHEVRRPDGLSGRDWELWQPVITLARFLDGFNVVEDSLHQRMATMAVERKNYKSKLEADANPQMKIVQIIWDYIHDKPASENWYDGLELRRHIKGEMDYEKLPADKTLGHIIFEQLQIADRQKDKDRRWNGQSKAQCYRLVPEVITERARHMFGIDLTGGDEPEPTPADDDFWDKD